MPRHDETFRSIRTLPSPVQSPQVGLPQALVRRKASFWVNHGLLTERLGTGRGDGAVRGVAGRGRRPWAVTTGWAAADKCPPPVYVRALTLDASLQGTGANISQAGFTFL
jgi:hypothetical protein